MFTVIFRVCFVYEDQIYKIYWYYIINFVCYVQCALHFEKSFKKKKKAITCKFDYYM